jgi:Leucine Rich repeat
MNNSLTVVDLSYNGLADNGALALSRCLRSNVHLTDLDITCNRISMVGAKTLASGLQMNGTLSVLKVIFKLFYYTLVLPH